MCEFFIPGCSYLKKFNQDAISFVAHKQVERGDYSCSSSPTHFCLRKLLMSLGNSNISCDPECPGKRRIIRDFVFSAK